MTTLTPVPANAFGFVPQESTHHFVVHIGRGASARVEISEHFTWDSVTGSSEISYGNRIDGQVKVILTRLKWDIIADAVRSHFNQRLRQQGLKPGAWKAGLNLLRRDLGKELVMLGWAIEEAEPETLTIALQNWLGLVPEERWWLYTQTAAATGHAIDGRSKGWRKALRYALTENPQPSESKLPSYFPKNREPSLFDLEQEDHIPNKSQNGTLDP